MLSLILLASGLIIEGRIVEIFDFSDMVIDNVFNESFLGKPHDEHKFPGMMIQKFFFFICVGILTLSLTGVDPFDSTPLEVLNALNLLMVSVPLVSLCSTCQREKV